MWTRCKGQQGYTLLEMLVSFSMLLLLTGTIIPLYVQMKEEEKKQSNQRERKNFFAL